MKTYLAVSILFTADENQGVGGLFYDDFSEPNLESCFNFVSSCCDAILPSYIPIVKKHMGKKYLEKEKLWQEIRRGRFAELDNFLQRCELVVT